MNYRIFLIISFIFSLTGCEQNNLKKDSILARAQFTPTLGKSFKEAGYNVAYFGKEHAGGYGYASATEFGSMTHSNGGMLAEGSAYDPIFTEIFLPLLSSIKQFIGFEYLSPK